METPPVFNSFNIDGDMKIIKPFLQDIKNYKALIINIRGNGGGDTRYWSDNLVTMLINKPLDNKEYEAYRGGSFTEQFIKNINGLDYTKLELVSNIDKEDLKDLPPEIKTDFKYYSKCITHCEPKNPIEFNGKIYLLVDKAVFSSSEAFAIFSQNTGFATLVGHTTGGDGIGSDPAICVLPNSGYIFRFIKGMGLISNGESNFEYKTEPNIKISSKMDLNLSKYEAVQTVLKLVN